MYYQNLIKSLLWQNDLIREVWAQCFVWFQMYVADTLIPKNMSLCNLENYVTIGDLSRLPCVYAAFVKRGQDEDMKLHECERGRRWNPKITHTQTQ